MIIIILLLLYYYYYNIIIIILLLVREGMVSLPWVLALDDIHGWKTFVPL